MHMKMSWGGCGTYIYTLITDESPSLKLLSGVLSCMMVCKKTDSIINGYVFWNSPRKMNEIPKDFSNCLSILCCFYGQIYSRKSWYCNNPTKKNIGKLIMQSIHSGKHFLRLVKIHQQKQNQGPDME